MNQKEFIESQIIKFCKDYSQEYCGFVVREKEGDSISVILGNNYAAKSEKNNVFEIHPLQFLSIRKNYEILAVWHSHNNSQREPSEGDIKNSEWVAIPYLIFDYFNQAFFLHIPKNYGGSTSWFA